MYFCLQVFLTESSLSHLKSKEILNFDKLKCFFLSLFSGLF
jgi:hypothetical protein